MPTVASVMGFLVFGSNRRCGSAGGCSDKDDTEVSAHSECARKKVEDHAGGSAGGHVIVGWGAAEEQIADATTGQKGLVAVAAQGADNVEGRFELGVGGVHRFA